MSVFVVLNCGHNEKYRVCYPDIYGPFDSEKEAEEFISEHPDYEDGLLWSPEGGYAAAHIVSETTATDPRGVADYWKEQRLEMEEA